MRLTYPGGPFLHIMYGMRFGDCSFCSSSSFSTSAVVPVLYYRGRKKTRTPRSKKKAVRTSVYHNHPELTIAQHRRATYSFTYRAALSRTARPRLRKNVRRRRQTSRLRLRTGAREPCFCCTALGTAGRQTQSYGCTPA